MPGTDVATVSFLNNDLYPVIILKHFGKVIKCSDGDSSKELYKH